MSSFDEAVLAFDMAILDAFAEVSPDSAKRERKEKEFRDTTGLEMIGAFGAATNSGQLKLYCIERLGFLTMPFGDVGMRPDELSLRITAINEIIEGNLPAEFKDSIIQKGRLAKESLERFQNDRALQLPLYRAVWGSERVGKLAREIKGF